MALPGFVTVNAGSGVMSHLGRVSWTLEHCYQLFAGTFSDAEVVITAANGDRLIGTFDGIMTGETTFAETLIITGGTGRFAGASGTSAAVTLSSCAAQHEAGYIWQSSCHFSVSTKHGNRTPLSPFPR